MKVPNFLTILRILSIPVFVISLLYEHLLLGFFVFVGAGITDGLDGWIARVYRQRTPIGEYLDPIADKLMLMSAFIVLAVLRIIPRWLTVIVITRDIIIVIGVLILFLTSHRVTIRPTFISKATTCFQIATIAWALLTPYSLFMKDIFRYIVWVAAVITCLAGLQYIYIGTQYLNEQGG
jgi:cardiolipin synthase